MNPACLKVLKEHTSVVNAVSITPEGMRAVSGSVDETLLCVWDLATGECLMVYRMKSRVNAVAVHGMGLAAGGTGGRLTIAAMENYCPGRFAVTAVRLWLFDRSMWDTRLTALCPWCGGRFDAEPYFNATNPASSQGLPGSQKTYVLKSAEINCPMPGCKKPLKLNPFVFDPSGY